MTKKRLNLTLDPYLNKILERLSCEKQLTKSDVIAVLISKETGIRLNKNYGVDEADKKEYQLKCINDKINELSAKRDKLLNHDGELNNE